MPNSQIYSVFLLKSNKPDDAQFLFSFKQDPLLRPSVGDVLTQPFTLVQLKILFDLVSLQDATFFRFTDDTRRRITDPDGDIRISQEGVDPVELTSHNYFVTPANNPNRITSYSTSGFANDQTLKQLFK